MASSLINNKYRITNRIGGGGFGEVYRGVGLDNEKVGGMGPKLAASCCKCLTSFAIPFLQVAVKIERQGTEHTQLRHEYKVYRELTGCRGFSSVSLAVVPSSGFD
jgi:serine/threonine protein kinase